MSNINYNIWGTPIQWGLSTNPTTETLFGGSRVGASTWSDNDFDDYPSFKISDKTNLRNLLVNSNISLNEPLDNTLSYTAIANSLLPQANIYLFNSMHFSVDDYIAKNKDTITPFSLAYWYRNEVIDSPSVYGQLQGFDGFPNNPAVINTEKLQRFSPFADYDTTYNNNYGYYNPILRIAPVLEFGIKSVILEINVVYTEYDTTSATTNLKTYLNNTDEWLHNHPIHSAYCIPYFRTNTNGTYNRAKINASTRFSGISPVFYNPYKLKYAEFDIYNYLQAFTYSDSGMFPIFGTPVNDSFYSTIGITCTRVPDNEITVTNMSQYAIVFGADKGTITATGNSSSRLIYMSLDLSDPDNVEYIMRGAAAYGLFFCQAIGTLGNSGRDSGASERWIDNEMYCGVIESDGMTYGDYTQGEDNKDNRVYSWTDSTQTPFDPANIPDTDNTKYDYETQYPSWNLVPSTCNMYVVSQSAIEKLSDIIATAIAGRPDPDQLSTVDYALNNGLTNNPIDTIISVRAYAAKQLPYSTLIPTEVIKCGAWYNNSVQGHKLSRTSDSIDFHFRRSTQNGLVAKYGNSFLDYASYTRAELIIPYCGTVALQAADFLNHDINVRIIVDYITGMCTAFVMRDLVAIATVSGSMGVDIPVTGLQNATLAAQRVNAVLQRDNANLNTAGAAVGAVASTIGFAASLATGNVVGALGSGTGLLSSINRFSQSDNQIQKADYDIQHMQAPVKSIQSATPNISFRYEHTCRLIIYRPVLSSDYVPEIYGHTVGFACLINGKVKQFSGLTVGTIDTAGIAATDTEKAMIQKAFASGVYL